MRLITTLRPIGIQAITMVYTDFFVYTGEYSDFRRGFELTEKIVCDVRSRIRGFNFNRYSESNEGSPKADPREHITVRIDTESADALQCIEARLQSMKNQGEILDWCRGEDNPYDIAPMRDYPLVIHIAHETSTACAYRLYRQLKARPSEFVRFMQNPVGYLDRFLPLWLRDSGFKLFAFLPTHTGLDVEQIADACAESFRSIVDKNRITDSKIFAERVVHSFLNCVAIGGTYENQLIRSMLTSLQLRDSDELWRRLGTSLVE